jgi:hypothetical protein
VNLAGWTGLEPAASGVTGQRYNQLNYHPKQSNESVFTPCPIPCQALFFPSVQKMSIPG